jgi:hypothetical protein
MQMDPLGLAFEQYDPLGRFSAVDGDKKAIDASGKLEDTDVDGPFQGAVELAERLGASGDARVCLEGKMLEYALGRALVPQDRCAQQGLDQRVKAAGGHLSDMFLAVVQSAAFRNRTGGN